MKSYEVKNASFLPKVGTWMGTTDFINKNTVVIPPYLSIPKEGDMVLFNGVTSRLIEVISKSEDKKENKPIWTVMFRYCEEINSFRCECGSEKLNLGGHSHWCPKAKI